MHSFVTSKNVKWCRLIWPTLYNILLHRRQSLFGHIARLDPSVPANAALQLMVNSHEDKKPSTTWTRPSGRPRRTRGSTTSKTLMLDRCQQCGDLRLLEVTEERNGPLGLRDDDDDDSRWLKVVKLCS